MLERPPDKSFGQRIGQDFHGRLRAGQTRPGGRHLGRTVACVLQEACGQGPQFAERVGHAIRAKAEAIFDAQRDVHAVEAVQTNLIQQGLRPLVRVGQGPSQVLLDEFIDGVNGGGLDRSQIDLLRSGEIGESVGPGAQAAMIGNIHRRFRSAAIVPLFQEGIELFTIQPRQITTVEHLDRHGHLAPRREEQQIGAHPADGAQHATTQLGA